MYIIYGGFILNRLLNDFDYIVECTVLPDILMTEKSFFFLHVYEE